MKRINRLARVLAGALALCLATGVAAKDTIRIGWTAWSDAEFATKLAAKLLEDRMAMTSSSCRPTSRRSTRASPPATST